MKTVNVIIFQAINCGLNSAINIKIIWIKCCNEWQDVDGFLGFRLFVELKGSSEVLVLLANLGNGFLINLILSFSNVLICHHYFLHSTNPSC